jgi:hypothetical protein
MSDLVKGHKGFLKHVTNTFNVIILCVSKGSTGQLGKGRGL